MNPGLPHHRRGPRVDERTRWDDDVPAFINLILACAYVAGVVLLVLFAFGVIA
jgi:hypothetical protein